jgi:urease accessory protein
MPGNVVGLVYGLGFMVATGLLQLGGIGLGFLVGAAGDRYGLALRSAGGLAALAGLAILSGAL